MRSSVIALPNTFFIEKCIEPQIDIVDPSMYQLICLLCKNQGLFRRPLTLDVPGSASVSAENIFAHIASSAESNFLKDLISSTQSD